MTSVGTILTERGVSIVGRTALRPCLRAPWTCWLTAADARPPSEAPCCSCTVHSTLHYTLHCLHTSLICMTTSQRVLTIHRIIPTLVTSWWASSFWSRDVYKSAALCCRGIHCLHCVMHFNPQNCPFPGRDQGPSHGTWFPVSTIQMPSRSVCPVSVGFTVVTTTDR